MNRQIVLDTETTGLEVGQGHRIIEIGCIELRDRRLTRNQFHHYLNPERIIDAGAIEIHGIGNELLADKPRFVDVAEALIAYLRGAELIIHNAGFDVGFLDAEFERAGRQERIAGLCTVTDTLSLARRLHPGSRVTLDALCKRYAVDNSNRGLHGALLDARLLADVYLSMTGGQSKLLLERNNKDIEDNILEDIINKLGESSKQPMRVICAAGDELSRHHKRLAGIAAKAGHCLWSDDLKGQDEMKAR